HVVVVEPLGLLARKRQDLLGTRSKIIHDCISDTGASCMTLLKVDPGIRASTFNSTYSAWWIKQSIKRAMANQGKTVTTRINALLSMAKAESDHTADNFLQWF